MTSVDPSAATSDIIPYAGWSSCRRLRRGAVELVVTLEVGPRVIRFGFVDRPNEFVEYPEQTGKSGETVYRSYGGHRLWVAPETAGWTNHPDNHSVEAEGSDDAFTFRAPTEAGTGLQKELRISFLGHPTGVRVAHAVTNRGKNVVTLAPWALSVMAPGGTLFVPQEPHLAHAQKVLPARPMVLWHYTDMQDPRWNWGSRLIALRQSTDAKGPQKFGVQSTEGWAAYARGDRIFLKRFPHDASATYPDFGCNGEFFTNSRMLEVESLGPLQNLEPGATARHIEHWYLFQDRPMPAQETGQETLLRSLVRETEQPVTDAAG